MDKKVYIAHDLGLHMDHAGTLKLRWILKRYLIGIIIIICSNLFLTCNIASVRAGTYDNAITFWNEFKNMGTQNGKYFFFCTRGSTSQSGTKYKTIGYSVTVNLDSTILSAAQFKMDTSYDLNTRESGGYTYVLRKIPVSKVQDRIQLANNEKVLYKLYTENQNYVFDSIMTVTENGNAKGSISEKNTGKISASGEVYTTLAGIKGARSWSNPSDLNSYYNKRVVVSPVNPLSSSRITVTGNHVYDVGLRDGDYTYYVKTGTNAKLSFTSTAEFISDNFKPNANLFHLTGYGDNDCIDVRTQMENSSSLYWRNSGAISVLGVSAARNSKSLTSNITGAMNIPNENNIYVYPQGKIFLKYSITANQNRRSDDYIACDTTKYDSSKRVKIIGDSVAPSISFQGNTVSSFDSGSGVRCLIALTLDGSYYDTWNTSSYIIPAGSFLIYAEDNVGNQSQRITVSSKAEVNIYVSNYGGWNPNNVQIRGTTDKGKIGAFAIWCLSLGETEDSASAVIIPVDGKDVTVSFNPTRYYANEDGTYKIMVKTVVFDAFRGEYLGEDSVLFNVNMDYTPPALGWGSMCEKEFKWGKEGEAYPFSCISKDYNRKNTHGDLYTSGVQTLTLMNEDTGEILSSGKYKEDILHFYTEASIKKDTRIKIQAYDQAGNLSEGYTKLIFDNLKPRIVMSILYEEGLYNKATGWRNGIVNLIATYIDEETGIDGAVWRSYDPVNKTTIDMKTLVPFTTDPYWKKYYPTMALERNKVGTAQYSYSTEGNYDILLHVADGCENVGTQGINLKIDSTPPRIVMEESNIWNPESISVNFDDSKIGVNEVSGIEKTRIYYYTQTGILSVSEYSNEQQCEIKPFTDFFKNLTYKNYRKDGAHRFMLETKDKAGNITTRDYNIYVDEAKPSYTVTTDGGVGKSNWNPKTLYFTFRDETSGLRYYRIQKEYKGERITCKEYGNNLKEKESSIIGSNNFGNEISVTVDLKEYEGGIFYIEAEDEAGNTLISTYEPPWDSVKPECNIEYLEETNGWNPRYVQLSFSDDKSGLAKIQVIEAWKEGRIKVDKEYSDGQILMNYVIERIETKDYGENAENLSWYARDHAGNQVTGDISLNIDRTAPKGNVSYNQDTNLVMVHDIIEERSGVYAVWVEIFREGDSSNRQHISLSEDSQTCWKGEIVPWEEFLTANDSFLEVKIKDKAGNEALLERFKLNSFTISATIQRSLSPENADSIFKSGEQGFLTIRTSGYVERVTIKFSSELIPYDNQLDNIEYSLTPKWQDGLVHYFYVPLYVLNGDYDVFVTGFKGNESKDVPLILPVRDTILNDFRTRIRG